jgi:phage protein U
MAGPTDFQDKQEVELAEHPVVGGKTRLQLTGLKPEEITLQITLHTSTTESPEADLLYLKACMESGEVLDLVLGRHDSGVYAGKYVLAGIDHQRAEQWPNGKIRHATATIRLREWVKPPDLVVSSRKTPPTGIKSKTGAGKGLSPAVQSKIVTNKDGVSVTEVGK